jgi:hypothetical protein
MRNRHKVPGGSGAASHLRSLFFRIVLATNLEHDLRRRQH